MKKENLYHIILFIFTLVGVGLVAYSTLQIHNYEGMRELRKEATEPVRIHLTIAIIILVIAYILTYMKGLFKK